MFQDSSHESTQTLLDMLTYARPAGSHTEAMFIKDHIDPLGVQSDAFGNRYKRVGTSSALWSCHTDTVHKRHGRQTVIVENGVVYGTSKKWGCLGADDGAGVWLMSEMIKAGVPGLYVFHREEEVGGNGSIHIAQKNPEFLGGIDMAIALDRGGFGDVITHQGSRCCSDRFAQSLANALGLGFRPSPDGIFTDTANYINLIGECTNLSVGYEHAHSPNETVDIGFLFKLRDSLISMDTNNLELLRTPGEVDESYLEWVRGGYHSKGIKTTLLGDSYPDHRYDLTLDELCMDYPLAAADMLREMGLDERDLLEWMGITKRS
jgi:acetylornithine deacetylase/succinyl-diaminopimelate desuccinylase-like protein